MEIQYKGPNLIFMRPSGYDNCENISLVFKHIYIFKHLKCMFKLKKVENTIYMCVYIYRYIC